MRLSSTPLVLVLFGALVAGACGSAEDTDSGGLSGVGGSAGAGGKTATAGAGGRSGGGGVGGKSAGGAAGSTVAGGGGGSTATAGSAGATSGGAGSAGVAPAGGGSAGSPLIGMGGADGCGNTQCTNCLDDDGDGLVDGFDPDCTGYIDNDESSFATGIPGDNVDACKQDCFFDGNSGQGDDKCEWNLACDPANPGKNTGCPYDPKAKKCPTTQSAACVKNCFANVPNGCDCFGCCAFQTPTGPKNALLVATCSYADINNPDKCPPCTQQPSCLNACEPCEYCLGKTTLPPACNPPQGGGGSGGSTPGGGGTGQGGEGGAVAAGGMGTGGTPSEPLPTCGAGVVACTPTSLCPAGNYCLTGCCVFIPK